MTTIEDKACFGCCVLELLSGVFGCCLFAGLFWFLLA